MEYDSRTEYSDYWRKPHNDYRGGPAFDVKGREVDNAKSASWRPFGWTYNRILEDKWEKLNKNQQNKLVDKKTDIINCFRDNYSKWVSEPSAGEYYNGTYEQLFERCFRQPNYKLGETKSFDRSQSASKSNSKGGKKGRKTRRARK